MACIYVFVFMCDSERVVVTVLVKELQLPHFCFITPSLPVNIHTRVCEVTYGVKVRCQRTLTCTKLTWKHSMEPSVPLMASHGEWHQSMFLVIFDFFSFILVSCSLFRHKCSSQPLLTWWCSQMERMWRKEHLPSVSFPLWVEKEMTTENSVRSGDRTEEGNYTALFVEHISTDIRYKWNVTVLFKSVWFNLKACQRFDIIFIVFSCSPFKSCQTSDIHLKRMKQDLLFVKEMPTYADVTLVVHKTCQLSGTESDFLKHIDIV